MVLEALDTVDWASAQHARGPAVDVPVWLRALASDDSKARRSALASLEGAIGHQGCATTAATLAAPFLVELLVAGFEPARLSLLLADLVAGGSHGTHAVTGLDPSALPAEARRMRDGIARGAHDKLLALLEDKDGKVRSAAAVAVSVLPERRDAAVVALRARLGREKSQEPAASMVLALALLDLGDPPIADLALLDRLAQGESALVRLAARIGIAQLSTDRNNALLAIKAAEGRPEVEKNVPYNGGQLADLAQRVALQGLVRSGDMEAISSLVESIGLQRVVPHGLKVLLGDKGLPAEPVAWEELPPKAAEFLTVVAKKIDLLSKRNNHFNPTLLESYGLCDLVRLAGLKEPRALDGRSGGQPRWRIARRVRDGRAPRETWIECVKGMSTAEVDDLLRDLVSTAPVPYALSTYWPKTKEGYDSTVETQMAYEALIADAARALPLEHVTSCMEWIAEAPQGGVILPIVDVYTEKLKGRPPDARFDRVLTLALGEVHCDGQAPRRILERVSQKRRASLIDTIDFNLLVSNAHDRPVAVYFRMAWSFGDLCPTRKMAEKAAASLVQRSLISDHQMEHADAILADAVPRLVTFFRAFETGKAALEAVLPRATPFTGRVITETLAQL